MWLPPGLKKRSKKNVTPCDVDRFRMWSTRSNLSTYWVLSHPSLLDKSSDSVPSCTASQMWLRFNWGVLDFSPSKQRWSKSEENEIKLNVVARSSWLCFLLFFEMHLCVTWRGSSSNHCLFDWKCVFWVLYLCIKCAIGTWPFWNPTLCCILIHTSLDILHIKSSQPYHICLVLLFLLLMPLLQFFKLTGTEWFDSKRETPPLTNASAVKGWSNTGTLPPGLKAATGIGHLLSRLILVSNHRI